jgi:hypothetical protein
MISILQKKAKFRSRRGFSLVEILIGSIILQIALLSFFLINQASNSQSMDAYYEFLGCSLGKEVLELCQGMEYEWAKSYKDKQDLFPLSTWHGVLDKPIFDKTTYFRECGAFERKISFTPVAKDGNGILVTVDIRVKEEGKVKTWLSRNKLSFSTIVMEKPML